ASIRNRYAEILWLLAVSSGCTCEHVACDEVDNGLEVSFGAVAFGLALGGLDVAVDRLQDAVGKAGGDRSEDAVGLGHDRPGQLLHRPEIADLNPCVPAVEEAPGRSGAHREQLLQVHADLHRL